MKKLLSILLILSALLCMPSCKGSDTADTSDMTDNGTKTDEPEQKTEYEDTYYSLRRLARKGDKRAEEKLDDFKLVYEREIYTNSDGDKTIADYTYDSNGNLIKTVKTNPNGDKNFTDHTYDTNGNLIK